MESMRSQISKSIQKIDLIYQILIQIGDRLLPGKTSTPEDTQSFDKNSSSNKHLHSDNSRNSRQNRVSYPSNGYANLPSGANYRYDTAEWVVAGQDLSIDNNGASIVREPTSVENRQQIREQDLSPQIQIQRLTAQLTVAYNRIAALEEQLLAKRWK